MHLRYFAKHNLFFKHHFLAFLCSYSRKLRHGSLVTYSKNQGGGQSSEDLAVTSLDFGSIICLQMSTYWHTQLMQIRPYDLLRPKHLWKHLSKNGTTFYCLLEAAGSFKTLPLLGTSFLCSGFLKYSFNFENKRHFLLVPSPSKVKLAVYFQNWGNI